MPTIDVDEEPSSASMHSASRTNSYDEIIN